MQDAGVLLVDHIDQLLISLLVLSEFVFELLFLRDLLLLLAILHSQVANYLVLVGSALLEHSFHVSLVLQRLLLLVLQLLLQLRQLFLVALTHSLVQLLLPVELLR